eukprot:11191994-Lingulodinium_polyedra.AAC.1
MLACLLTSRASSDEYGVCVSCDQACVVNVIVLLVVAEMVMMVVVWSMAQVFVGISNVVSVMAVVSKDALSEVAPSPERMKHYHQ